MNLDIADGEFLALVGPSGSGKTTALRMLAGLEDVDDGTISIGAREVNGVPPKDRDIAMVFQSYALYPHMTVAANMGFALRLSGENKAVVRDKVQAAARLLDLVPYLDRKPKALSGGQRQRVAMGRAIVRSPQVFLMDEPLSNLDAKLRVETRAHIAALQQRLSTTTVYVTHDQVEAHDPGPPGSPSWPTDGCKQVDTPRGLYDRPANAFVAGFIGSPAMNLIDLPVMADGIRLGDAVIPMPRSAVGGRSAVTFGVRPEALTVTGSNDDGFDMVVNLVEELGADAYLYGSVHAGGGSTHRINVRVDGRRPPPIGTSVRVGLRDAAEAHFFDPTTGARL